MEGHAVAAWAWPAEGCPAKGGGEKAVCKSCGCKSKKKGDDKKKK